MRHISELIDQMMSDISAGRPLFPTIPTGFPELDSYLCGGLLQSQIMTIGGYPGMGKRDLALQIAVNIAMQGRKVVYFSRHRSEDDSFKRLTALACKVPQYEMAHPSHLNTIKPFMQALRDKPLTILPYWAWCSSVLRYRKKAPLDIGDDCELLVVDDLQSLIDYVPKNSLCEEVSIALRRLRDVALDRRMPLVMISELNRKTLFWKNDAPVLSSCRDSGCIEEISDILVFLHRRNWKSHKASDSGTSMVDVHIAKNGFGGRCGNFQLPYSKSTGFYC